MAYKDKNRTKEYMRWYNKEKRDKTKAKLSCKMYRLTHKKEIKEYHRLRYIQNKSKIDNQHKEYYKLNKSKLDKQHKEYALNHKKERKQYWKLYYKNNIKNILYKNIEYRKKTKNGCWRLSKEYLIWKDKIYKRGNYKCQECSKSHCKLNAHHIKPAKDYPQLRYNVRNGICLCVECHKRKHYFN